MSIDLVPVGQVHAELMAAMHRICFAEPWDAKAMGDLLTMPTAAGLIAAENDSLIPAPGGSGPAGLVLWRIAADEAEILTICVLPPWRRHGLGARLLKAAMVQAHAAGAALLFLEVAATNSGGKALYDRLGFAEVGRRRRYYDNGADALTMRLELGRLELG
jgi:[ribosomal protein S18]-alanine N-acetyltransferase